LEDVILFQFALLISIIFFANFLAKSNLCSSDLALKSDLAPNHTYFVFPVISSFQDANHSKVLS